MGDIHQMPESSKKRISGTSWNIYLHILTSEKPQGVREIWRALNLSTPSLVQYHINKLQAMSLIEATDEGKYQASDVERMKVLRSFVLLRGRLVPRLVFYGGLVTGILMMYVLFCLLDGTSEISLFS